jgi:hypothetical protein
LVGDGFLQPGKLLGREGQTGGFLAGVLPSPLVTAAGRALGAGKDAALAFTNLIGVVKRADLCRKGVGTRANS